MDIKIYFLLLLSTVFCIAEDVKFYSIVNNTKQIVDIEKICTEERPCLAKCCGLDEKLYRRNNKTSCKKTKLHLDYTLFKIHDLKTNETINNETILNMFTIVHSDWYLDRQGNPTYRLNENDTVYNNGELRTDHFGPMISLNRLDYCLDFKAVNKPIIRIRQIYKEEGYLNDVLLSIAMYISAFVLLLNFIIYCILPQLSITEMMRAAYVTSMMLSFTFGASIKLSLMTGNLPSSRIQIIAPITYFITLSSFSWLSIMSLDIWWTLRGITKQRNIHRKGIKHKFLMYCIFGFGCPLMITIGAVTLDFVNIPRKWKPIFEDFFTASSQQCVMYFMHIPLSILVIFNWVLFIMSFYNIWRVKRQLSRFNSPETRNTQENQQKLRIFFKLSLAMGISWILDFMQSFIELYSEIKMTIDIYHSLCGLLIFYIFVYDDSLISRLEKRFGISLRRKKSCEVNKSSKTTRGSNSKRGKIKCEDTIMVDIKTDG